MIARLTRKSDIVLSVLAAAPALDNRLSLTTCDSTSAASKKTFWNFSGASDCSIVTSASAT